jgi:cytochrome c oxidase subunit 4
LSRGFATAAATHAETHGAAAAAAAPARKVAPISLSNVEARWTKLSEEEQAAVHEQLEGIQTKDWKELSVDERKAGG